MPKEGCAAVIALYIQNINLKGVKRTFSRLYISSQINGLEKNGPVWGLDKFSANRQKTNSVMKKTPGGPLKPGFGLSGMIPYPS
jgi:hypothetical protein